jgi:hypothetical protein
MHQPVQWHGWGEEAFEIAEREDKPILLDIGAVWCHWCHVMDRESYEDSTTAALINENFVAVKVDRDERPDVDARYQAAVSAIAGQGGWPLTAILTPAGKPFFGGTYFPPEDRYGRPGFKTVLERIAAAYRERRDEVLESAASVIDAIEFNESFAGRSGDLRPALLEKIVESAVKQFDPRNGGFGSQPKFPHPATLDLLLDEAARTGDEKVRETAIVTLEKMANGGIFDHLAGGFHRYSVDERWVVPHFEKMSYDNAGLLANYVHAFQSFVEPKFADAAKEIIRWMDEVLTDRERGGFYASQDADINLDDDGDYFTWTREEAAAVLTKEELGVTGPFYDIGDVGDMHHNPLKNVLHVKHTVEEIAKRAELSVEQTTELLRSAKKKLQAARLTRPTPFVDKTLYTHWNAMCISAYLAAARVLDLGEVRAFALRSLDRVLDEAWRDNQMSHVVAYADGPPRAHIAGMLDDYALLALASLDAWEATGEVRYYKLAEALADAMVERFYDATAGGFFDTEISDGQQLGALSARRKPLQDSPTPAGNASATSVLLRVAALSGRDDLRVKAEHTLEAFAGVVEHFGLYAAAYGIALQQWLTAPVEVCIVGEGDDARKLAAIATARYAVNKTVLVLRPDQIAAEALPPALAETLPHLPGLQTGEAFAVVCGNGRCSAPTNDPAELIEQTSAALDS